MARVPYLEKSDLSAEDRGLLDRPDNVARAMVNSPNARRVLNGVTRFIRYESRLDSRLREMAILQVGWLVRAPYEWSHHVKLAPEFGVSDDDIRAVIDSTAGRPTALDEITGAVLRAAREMTTGLTISDGTFAVLRSHLDAERTVDLVATIAYYNAVVRMLATLEIEVEDEYVPYLKKFPLPNP